MTDTFPIKPTLIQGESPSLYKYAPEDNSLKAQTDGGYEFRRPRFTRKLRNMIETGFIMLSHADFLVIDAFFIAHTTVTPFFYYDYIQGVNRTVRFDSYMPTYKGIGRNKMWDINIKMSEL